MPALLLSICGAAAVFADNRIPSERLSPVNIDITTHLGDQQTFVENDVVSFFLNLDRDAYIMVVYEDAGGDRYQVIPNKYQSHHFYSAGLFIAIPPEGADYRFRIASPYGEEHLWVFASDKPLAMYTGEFLSSGLKKLRVSIDQLRSSIKAQAINAYGEARLTIRTRGDK